MIVPERIGAIALNAAFVLYLIHYLPQLHHNRKKKQLQTISLHFHGLLGICYLSDLSYGMGMHLPWQYCTVSFIGTLCLAVQHQQLSALHRDNRIFHIYTWVFAAIFSLFILENALSPSPFFFLAMGYLAHTTALLFLLPVIIRNAKQKHARALSDGYLYLNSLCYLCNLIAALSLNWPFPSKIGASFGLGCLIILLLQRYYYHATTQRVRSGVQVIIMVINKALWVLIKH